jgi:regulator of extracellular matrix RemA (YlzA/DUF370 family)
MYQALLVTTSNRFILSGTQPEFVQAFIHHFHRYENANAPVRAFLTA